MLSKKEVKKLVSPSLYPAVITPTPCYKLYSGINHIDKQLTEAIGLQVSAGT